jgi:hypothetical protein
LQLMEICLSDAGAKLVLPCSVKSYDNAGPKREMGGCWGP